VLNLGVSGYQSEDIAKTIEKFLPILKPDLVVYAMCLNDFLPSGQGQYGNYYALPFPWKWKQFAVSHSRALQFTSDRYDAVLRRVGLRWTFLDDILKDFHNYQGRFRRDITRMEQTVRSAGAAPIIGMVVDQFPSGIIGEGPNVAYQGQEIALIGESAMTDTGFDLVSIKSFYRTYHADRFTVSRWEPHPNEVVNYIWAKMLFARLRQRVANARLAARSPD
jgi:hypothetical protein